MHADGDDGADILKSTVHGQQESESADMAGTRPLCIGVGRQGVCQRGGGSCAPEGHSATPPPLTGCPF